jgi:hypothetical protein
MTYRTIEPKAPNYPDLGLAVAIFATLYRSTIDERLRFFSSHIRSFSGMVQALRDGIEVIEETPYYKTMAALLGDRDRATLYFSDQGRGRVNKAVALRKVRGQWVPVSAHVRDQTRKPIRGGVEIYWPDAAGVPRAGLVVRQRIAIERFIVGTEDTPLLLSDLISDFEGRRAMSHCVALQTWMSRVKEPRLTVWHNDSRCELAIQPTAESDALVHPYAFSVERITPYRRSPETKLRVIHHIVSTEDVWPDTPGDNTAVTRVRETDSAGIPVRGALDIDGMRLLEYLLAYRVFPCLGVTDESGLSTPYTLSYTPLGICDVVTLDEPHRRWLMRVPQIKKDSEGRWRGNDALWEFLIDAVIHDPSPDEKARAWRFDGVRLFMGLMLGSKYESVESWPDHFNRVRKTLTEDETIELLARSGAYGQYRLYDHGIGEN